MIDFEPMRQVLQANFPLSETDWLAFSAIFQPFSAKRKVILTAEGDIERCVYFVLSGVQRSYAIGKDGRDTSLVFTYPPSFSGVADSFLLQQPSRYFFETLTPSTFLRANFTDLDTLMRNNHNVERLIRLMVSRTLAGVLERQIELQSFTAEERFRAMMKRSSHVLTLIPHKYLASYLGMDATNFSKLLATVKISG